MRVGDLVTSTQKPTIKAGDRVEIIQTILYNGQQGKVIEAGTDEDGYTIWDFDVVLDSGRRIGVQLEQMKLI